MKKIILIILLFATSAYGEMQLARTNPYVAGGNYTAAASGPCDGVTGSVLYLYNGDYTDDTDAACSSVGAKLDGTVVNATVTANYVLVETGDDYLQHSIDTSELPEAGATIWFSAYIIDGDSDGVVDNVPLFEIGNSSWDANNYITVQVMTDGAGNGKIAGQFKHGGTLDQAHTGADTAAHDTWYRCGYSFKTGEAGNDHAIMCTACGGGGTEADCAGKGTWVGATLEDDDLAVLSTTPDVIRYGNLNIAEGTDDIRIADVYILSGFQTADPF